MNDVIKISMWREWTGRAALSVLASLRVGFERIRGSRMARAVCWGILAALALTLWTLILFRVAQRDAQVAFEAWQVRFAEDHIAQQEAREIGFPPDPIEELHKQEASTFARLMAGLKLYGYGADDFRTLAQGIACRVANPAYPNTIVEVIEQAGQWPGYSEATEVTQANYDLASKILSELAAQEHPAISSDYVYASFERDCITLRDTWDISTRTHFWRAGE